MKRRRTMTRETAEGLAIQALSFIAGEPGRLGGFLAATGIGPTEIRSASREPGFLAGVLQHVASDESLAAAFAAEAQCGPDDIIEANVALGGEPWERSVP
jgi:hypothetical protein